MIVHPRIYLASQSPRRRELLKQIGVNFEVLLLRSDPRRKVDVNEEPLPDEAADAYVQRLSKEKAQVGCDSLAFRNLPPFPVLAADTVVSLESKLFGKPLDREEAVDMLRQLSGKTHQVLTAVSVAFQGQMETRLSTTTVDFIELSDERIRRYVLTNEAHDKAGAYGIQGHAGSFVKRIEGSYSGVVGLPLAETAELLTLFGYPVR
jgi:nucleoside triphosphate pyrophosphatase